MSAPGQGQSYGNLLSSSALFLNIRHDFPNRQYPERATSGLMRRKLRQPT
jgi:hypothetical protein